MQKYVGCIECLTINYVSPQVLGWARVAPLSCILLSQKRDRKAKHKEADNPTPLPVDPIICNVDSSAGNAERRCELQAGPQNSSKKYMPLSQLTVSCSHTIAEARQPEWSVFNAMKNNLSHLLLEEKIEDGGTPLQPYHQPNVPENRSSRPPKHTRRPNSKVLPIKNFIFLPPINSVQKAKGQLCSRMKAPEDALEENCCTFDKRSDTRGLRLEHVADQEFPIYTSTLTAKYQTCQHHRFSDVNVSLPKRHRVKMSSKPDIVH